MKKWLALLCLLLLTGCSGQNEELDRAMALRAKLLSCGCSFDGTITADYGDSVYTFSVTCEADSQGKLGFQVTKPETIAGISGVFAAEDGALTFEGTVLTVPLLADGQISPAGAPWIFLKTLRGGYLTAVGTEGDYLRLTIDDSYAENALQVDIWLNEADLPVRADFLYDGRRILAMDIEHFEIV